MNKLIQIITLLAIFSIAPVSSAYANEDTTDGSSNKDTMAESANKDTTDEGESRYKDVVRPDLR